MKSLASCLKVQQKTGLTAKLGKHKADIFKVGSQSSQGAKPTKLIN